jgi:hypothetical protein
MESSIPIRLLGSGTSCNLEKSTEIRYADVVVWSISMAVSRTFSSLLEQNLKNVRPPSKYETLRKKLMESRPTHKATPIKQSPENSLKIEDSGAETE